MRNKVRIYANASSKNGTLDMFANYEIILFKGQKWFQYEFLVLSEI